MPLPADIPFGYVVGRYTLAVGDTSSDPDFLPDPVPATGTIRFTPVVPRVLSSMAEPTTVIPQTVQTTLNNGVLVDGTGREGVWLVAGQYDVTFQLQAGVALASVRITVTAEHTEENPLDLSLASPVPAPPAVQWVVNEQVYQDTLAARDEAEYAAQVATGGAPVQGDLIWSGHTWDRRTGSGGPQFNGQWASETGATTDAQGNLHLKVQRIDDVVHAAEIMSTRNGWGYGKYRFVVASPLTGMYPNVVLGMFTYDGLNTPSHNEIDIEASGWSYGAPAWSHTYWRPGVGEEPGNRSVPVSDFPVTTAPVTTHEFEWVPGRITWRTWLGTDTSLVPDREAVAVHGEPYSFLHPNGLTFSGTHNVPVPGTERVMLNLWVYNENPASPAEDTPDTEVVIRSFEFTSLEDLANPADVLYTWPQAPTAITNMAAAAGFWAGGSPRLNPADLTLYSEIRVNVFRGGGAGATGATLYPLYVPESDFGSVGTFASWTEIPGAAVDIAGGAGTALQSAWVPLPAEFRGPGALTIGQQGGDGVADPQIGTVWIEAR